MPTLHINNHILGKQVVTIGCEIVNNDPESAHHYSVLAAFQGLRSQVTRLQTLKEVEEYNAGAAVRLSL